MHDAAWSRSVVPLGKLPFPRRLKEADHIRLSRCAVSLRVRLVQRPDFSMHQAHTKNVLELSRCQLDQKHIIHLPASVHAVSGYVST